MTGRSPVLKHPRARPSLARPAGKSPRASSLILGLTLVLIVAATLASAFMHSFAAAAPIAAL